MYDVDYTNAENGDVIMDSLLIRYARGIFYLFYLIQLRNGTFQENKLNLNNDRRKQNFDYFKKLCATFLLPAKRTLSISMCVVFILLFVHLYGKYAVEPPLSGHLST